MEEDLYKKIWELSRYSDKAAPYKELKRLTKELIRSYYLQGRLSEHPFASARERRISLPSEKIHSELNGSICLITGGLGCVGSALIEELLHFNVQRIVVLHRLDQATVANAPVRSEKIVYVNCDITDIKSINSAFIAHRPDLVFHTAAQRNPGYAEKNIVHTVDTNVLGTYNVVRACELAKSVKQCVFSSTGKASRYYTEEVYAATKKLCEYILATYSKESKIKYSMVRFTHILDNSLMDRELRYASDNDDYVAVHSPGKFVTAQNVKEAACLMLNALIYSEDNRCKFLLVRNLEWPVESLQVALYYIKQSGRDIPIIFQGNPTGYDESFFRGQLDWSDPTELNLLINVYENRHREHNQEGDIIISHIHGSEKEKLELVIRQLQTAKGEAQTKEYLTEGLKILVKEALENEPEQETLNILKWGLQLPADSIDKAAAAKHSPMASLLFEALENKYATRNHQFV
ncbi:polysaccharide biosynthesis protein [Hymenobacter tibetensis]|uniref:Polysaccharide biosynthesis protein n=1 Tax=Hymenobacter tibetensis TaxID=497967 RepID=A0ABY4CYB6_9BACT|nr:polysaccharide biosynthesis protein [Hymenobacter tibetensis]UOG75261.1 polysaccharide biosynthesis protein [Hymenobacter tibetensis]